ncbi:tetratricopeptide repeat protein [Marinobacter confluentis]|uniref:Uncharacterized protein n=1 Tax=Marinobacter confluentis TaxID=1697557 RepID=A0A4Z1BW22_9GAMM|nr:hypothetical protein [Marinobacter confluentis]TGN41549.1 hypothetical protein E5Q11_03175 [Marinobacter confluentis]
MQEWIRKLNPTRCFALVLALISHSSVLAQTGHPDLDLGIARFAEHNGQSAEALWYTQTPESEAESLVRARALINTGRQSQAVELLDRLIDGDYYRGEAALLRSDLIEDNPAETERLLTLASEKGHGEIRQRALYQLADMARTGDRPERAGQILATMDPGYWAALGYMNIAADYGKRDLNPSRALISLRVALAMAEEDPDRRRGEALKARLLVRAGLLAYEAGDYDKAISFLEKVALESYSTPQGLYLHGLALSAKGNQRDAMQSWHRAKKYPLAFAGVAEAWLGTGRGYDLTGYLGQAGEAYLAASASYESERVTLRKLADLVRDKGAFEALVSGAGETQTEWFLADSRMLTQPRSAYLLRFMENADAQAAVGRVSTLETQLDRMAQQERTLTVFQGVLSERLKESSGQAGISDAFRDRFEATLKRISGAKDAASAGSPEAKRLDQLALTLADVKDSANLFGPRLAQRDQTLRRLSGRIEKALVSLRQNRQRARQALDSANADLDRRVLAYVNAEADRMVTALEKAEQQIAHLYEYLALQNLKQGAP